MATVKSWRDIVKKADPNFDDKDRDQPIVYYFRNPKRDPKPLYSS